MSPRVNIQYSIKLEDLDKEVKRLLDKAHFQIHNLKGEAKATEVLSLAALREVAQYRETLAEADQMLSDVMNIINGYISFQTSETYSVQGEQLSHQVEMADANPSLDTIERRLADFKTSIEAPNELSPAG